MRHPSSLRVKPPGAIRGHLHESTKRTDWWKMPGAASIRPGTECVLLPRSLINSVKRRFNRSRSQESESVSVVEAMPTAVVDVTGRAAPLVT